MHAKFVSSRIGQHSGQHSWPVHYLSYVMRYFGSVCHADPTFKISMLQIKHSNNRNNHQRTIK